jgi:hypothetical protein
MWHKDTLFFIYKYHRKYMCMYPNLIKEMLRKIKRKHSSQFVNYPKLWIIYIYIHSEMYLTSAFFICIYAWLQSWISCACSWFANRRTSASSYWSRSLLKIKPNWTMHIQSFQNECYAWVNYLNNSVIL